MIMKKNFVLIALALPVACAFARNELATMHERPTGELQEKAQAADIAVDGCADVRVSQDVVTVTSTGAVSFVRL